jgi:hypothetical protein
VKIDIPELLLHLRAEITEIRSRSQEAGAGGGKAEGSRQKAKGRGQEEGQEQGAGSWITKKRMERVAFKIYAIVMGSPGLYEWNAKVGRLFQGLIMREGRIGKVGATLSRLAPPLGAWTGARDLRPIAQRSFRELWRDGLANDRQGDSTLNRGGPFTGTAGVPPAASAKREH